MVPQDSAHQRLVVGDRQSRRVAPGVRLPGELEVPDDVGHGNTQSSEALKKVEDDVRVPCFDRAEERRKIIDQAVELDIVTQFAEGGNDVELRFPRVVFLLGQTVERLRKLHVLIGYNENA